MRIAESVDTRNVVALLAHAEAIGAKALTAFCTQFIHRCVHFSQLTYPHD